MRKPECPSCKRKISWKDLWFYRRSSFGKCTHCAEWYKINYAAFFYVIFVVLLCLAIFGSILFYVALGKGAAMGCMIFFAVVFTAYYLILPLFMQLKRFDPYEKKGRKK